VALTLVYMWCVALLTLAAGAYAGFEDSGFGAWFMDSLEEVSEVELYFEGRVPDYVRGSFVQAGPAKWGMGKTRMTHVFDGYGKINRLEFGPEGKVTFTSEFIQSSFLKDSVKLNEVAPSVLMGYTDPPSRSGPQDVMFARLDNNYIKTQKFGDIPVILSDSMVVGVLSQNFTHLEDVVRPAMNHFTPGRQWEDHGTAVTGDICMLGTMSHGHTDLKTRKFYGIMGCNGISTALGLTMQDYHVVFTIDPATPFRRDLVAKIPLPWGRPASYMHAMGFTNNHLVLIAQPLHYDLLKVMAGHSITDGGLFVGKGGTIFQVVNRHNSSVRTFQAPDFLFAHVVNSWEENDDIVLDVTWYHVDNQLSFMKLFLFDVAMNKTVRDKMALPRIMRFRLKADGAVEQSNLFADEPNTMFEMPKINPEFERRKHCVMYAFQGHCYNYNKSMNSTEAGPYAAIGVGKRNLCTGERLGFYASNEYPTEPEFIPRPGAIIEDDGVLVHLVFDANTNSSYAQVLDARTMERVARASLPVRVPYTFHSTFFAVQDDQKGSQFVV